MDLHWYGPFQVYLTPSVTLSYISHSSVYTQAPSNEIGNRSYTLMVQYWSFTNITNIIYIAQNKWAFKNCTEVTSVLYWVRKNLKSPEQWKIKKPKEEPQSWDPSPEAWQMYNRSQMYRLHQCEHWQSIYNIANAY